mmetsp:Transcript_26786/g.48279  ORF Transcript_26786/g.48279 Transcript_26786/m.48279 type:complete len:222 (+) Transcript_26786:11-676(+)
MFAETFKYPRVIVVLVQDLDLSSSSSSIDELFAAGTTGQALLKSDATFFESYTSKPDAQHVWLSNVDLFIPHTRVHLHEVTPALKTSTAAVQTVYLKADSDSQREVQGAVSAIIDEFKSTFRLYVVFYPAVFVNTLPSDKPYSGLIPKQSYSFQNCYDISSALDTSRAALYVEYEQDYTRKDWIGSLAQAQREEGGNRTILMEHLAREVAFRTGYAWKYGS